MICEQDIKSSIKVLLDQEDAFTMSIEMIGIHGLCSNYHNHILRMKVESKPLKIDGREYKVFSSIRGSFAIIFKEVCKKDNDETINDMFNINSENFAFDLKEFKEFCKGLGDFKPLIKCSDKNFCLYDLRISDSDLFAINTAFKNFTKILLKQIKNGTNKELNSFKTKFQGECK